MNGLLLALQFFTIVPIKKELPLGRKEVTAMYVALPFVGAAIGCLMYVVYSFMFDLLGMGILLTAVFIVLSGIVQTGGLHLDGWADTGDAFFSYKDRKKRLDILADPRLGAFGTMALLFLIIVKIALFHEYLLRDSVSPLLFLVIPFLARASMNLYFTTISSAKNEGLAHFFKEKIQTKSVAGLSAVASVLVLIGLGFLLENVWMPITISLVIGVSDYAVSELVVKALRWCHRRLIWSVH